METKYILKLKEGDLLRFIKDVEINGYKWKHTDLLRIEYVEIFGGGRIEWWIRNLTWYDADKYPSVQKFGMGWLLDYAHRVETVNNDIHTVFSHKYDVGDTIWLMENNKPKSFKITELKYTENLDHEPDFSYICSDGNTINDRLLDDNCDIYASKDELLDSLR